MVVIQEYCIKITWTNLALLKFISLVPPDRYCLIVHTPTCALGLIVGTEIMELLTNEITPIDVEYIERHQFKAELIQKNKILGTFE